MYRKVNGHFELSNRQTIPQLSKANLSFIHPPIFTHSIILLFNMSDLSATTSNSSSCMHVILSPSETATLRSMGLDHEQDAQLLTQCLQQLESGHTNVQYHNKSIDKMTVEEFLKLQCDLHVSDLCIYHKHARMHAHMFMLA